MGTSVALAVLVGAPWLPYWSVQGLETPAVTLLLTLGWVRYLEEVDADRGAHLAGPALGLAPVVRPDAALAVALIGLWHLVRPGPAWTPRARRAVVTVGLAGVALVVLKLVWFGAILPNPFHVKTGADAPLRGLQYLRHLATVPHPALPALLGVGLLVGPGLALRRDDRALPAVLALGWLAMVGLVGGDFMANFRFVVPVWPALAAALGVGVDALVRGVGRRSRVGGGLVSAVSLVAVVASLWGPAHLDRFDQATRADPPPPTRKPAPVLAPWRHPTTLGELESRMDWPAAFALVYARADEPVATTDIGLPAWVNDTVPIVDLLGLTDRVMSGRAGEDRDTQWACLHDRVRYVVLDTQGGSWPRYWSSLARDGWRVVGACDHVWALANPTRGPEAVMPVEDVELECRLDDLLRRTPESASLHEAVALEMAHAGVSRDVVAGFVAGLVDLHGAPWMRRSGVALHCDLGLRRDCAPRPGACARWLWRPDGALLQDPAQWPQPRDDTPAGPPEPPPPPPPPAPALEVDPHAPCRAAVAVARAGWTAAADAWAGVGQPAPGAEARVAANRSRATPELAWTAAQDALSVAEAAVGEGASPAQAAARDASRAAHAAGDAARLACDGG